MPTVSPGNYSKTTRGTGQTRGIGVRKQGMGRTQRRRKGGGTRVRAETATKTEGPTDHKKSRSSKCGHRVSGLEQIQLNHLSRRPGSQKRRDSVSDGWEEVGDPDLGGRENESKGTPRWRKIAPDQRSIRRLFKKNTEGESSEAPAKVAEDHGKV